jgi:hypothetical protein
MTTRLPSRAKTTSAAKTNISGRWRITEMDLREQEAIDLLGPAFTGSRTVGPTSTSPGTATTSAIPRAAEAG